MKRLLKFSWIIIAVVLGLTVFFSTQIGTIRIENSERFFFPQKHESYQRLLQAEETFGSMNSMGISLETEMDSIITAENINIIDRITTRLKNVEFIESVDSITGIDYIYGEDGALVAGPLIGDDYAGTSEDVEMVRRRISDWEDMYDRVIISDNGRAAQIQVVISTDASPTQTENLLREAEKIVKEETAGSGLKVRFYGDPVISDNCKTFMLSDFARLIPLVSIVVLLTLLFSFKTLEGTIFPLITVIISTVWTCGLMSLFDVTFTLVSSVIPVALIGVGSAYGIHVLTHYYVALDAFKGEMTKEKHREIIAEGVKDVWQAVFLAGITTIIGFISLISSPLGPLHSFAVFSAFGVALSLILSVVFIPALLAVQPLSRVGARSKKMEKLVKKMQDKIAARGKRFELEGGPGSGLVKIFKFFCGTKVRLTLFLIVICVASYFGTERLRVDSATINYFSPDSQFRQDVDYVDDIFAGTNSLYLVVEGQEKGDLTNPEILKAVDDLQSYLENKYSDIGKTVSFTTFIKRMNQVMHIPEFGETAFAGNAAYEGVEPYTGSGGELSSFDGDGSFSSFSSFYDDSGAFGEEGLSSFGSFYSETDISGTGDPVSQKEFVDPNIEYSRRLSETISIGDALEMLNRVYAQAGGKHATLEDMVNLLAKELNFNGMDYYEIPYDVDKYPAATREELSDLVSQYLLLFSGSLDRFADDQLSPKSIRVMIQLRTHSSEAVNGIVVDAQNFAENHFPEGYTVYATGSAEMQFVMTNLIVSSQLFSLLFSLLSVFVVISIYFRSAWAGLLGAVPLGLTILLNYMVMGFVGISLDLITSIIASVAIGVGIDYTIHFLTTYKNERALSDDLNKVTCNTFAKSGRGIVTNAIAVGLGFLVLVFSEFIVLRYIGILVSVVMFTSSMLAMTVIPGFLVIFDPKFIRPKKQYFNEAENTGESGGSAPKN